MASLLDLLGGGLLGFGPVPSPSDPAWEAIRAKLAREQGGGGGGLMAPGPAVDWSAVGGTPTSPISMPNLMAPGPAVDWSAVGGAIPQDQFGAGAQPFNPYTIAAPAAAAPAAAPAPSPPPRMLEDRPRPPVAAPAPQQRAAAPPAPAYAPPQATGPDIGGNLMAGLQNVLYQPFSPQGIGNMITGLMTGQRTDPVGASQQIAQRTYQTMREAGYSHPDALMAATNPQVMSEIIKNAYAQPKFEKAGPGEAAYLVGGGLGRLGPGGGGASGVGGAGVTQLQPGMTVQEHAAQQAAGTAQGQAAAKLPATLQSADNALALIDAVQKHPGRGSFSSSGPGGKLPAIPGTSAYDYRALLDQLKGQAFLSAFTQLHGGGQISNIEGEKATAAIAQLDLAQSAQARDTAINTLKGILEAGRANAIKTAQGQTEPFPTPQRSAAPQVGGNWTQVTPNIRVRPAQ